MNPEDEAVKELLGRIPNECGQLIGSWEEDFCNDVSQQEQMLTGAQHSKAKQIIEKCQEAGHLLD